MSSADYLTQLKNNSNLEPYWVDSYVLVCPLGTVLSEPDLFVDTTFVSFPTIGKEITYKYIGSSFDTLTGKEEVMFWLVSFNHPSDSFARPGGSVYRVSRVETKNTIRCRKTTELYCGSDDTTEIMTTLLNMKLC